MIVTLAVFSAAGMALNFAMHFSQQNPIVWPLNSVVHPFVPMASFEIGHLALAMAWPVDLVEWQEASAISADAITIRMVVFMVG